MLSITTLAVTSFSLGLLAQQPDNKVQDPQNSACSVPVDSDGFPTALSAELEAVRKVVLDKGGGKNFYGKQDPATKAVIKEFVKKFPLSTQTRELHQKSLTLLEKLEGTKDPEEAKKIRAESYTLAKQLTADRCYVQIIRALSKKFPGSARSGPAL